MKHLKKLASLLLALVMLLGLAAAASAAQEGTLGGGSITINDAVAGQTYSIYQLMYLESYNEAAGAYAYKANSAWETWLRTQTDYVTFDDQGYVTWVDGEVTDEQIAAFAKAAKKHAEETTSITYDETTTATSTTVKFTELKLGYYLVDSTLGTICSLNTTNPDVEIDEKNAEPTCVKEVEEDSNGVYGATNDADIGQAVNFKSTITLPKGSENIVFYDTMGAGFDLDNTTIKVYTDEAMTSELNSSNYTVNAPAPATRADSQPTFEISFKQTEYLDTLTETATLYVKYSAKVNSNAVIGGEGNPNTCKLRYGDHDGDGTKYYTLASTTRTYVWGFDVLKYANGDESKVLKGAEFVLLNNDKTKVAAIVDGKLTGWVDVPAADANGEITWPGNTVQITDINGNISIDGLDGDTYYLRETKAPDGYNKLADVVEVEIKPTVDATTQTLSLAPVTEKVENKSGSILPGTGGIGTTIFYVAGSILLVGAAVLLIVKKRMSVTK